MKTSIMKKSLLPASCRVMALAVVCLVAARLPASAQVSIPVPDYSFDTWNSTNPYANQYPVGYSPYPTAQIFTGWATTSANYKFYRVPTTGDTGTFQGANAAEVDYPIVSTTESLNPVVTSIDNNAVYTLTVALSSSQAAAGSVTLELLSTTSATDTTDYSNPANDKSGSNPTSLPNPTPIITTVATLASTTISGATINAQGAGHYVDYSVSFNTLNGANSSLVGKNVTIAVVVNSTSYSQCTDFDNVRLTETNQPFVFHSTKSANPGDVIELQGDNFGPNPQVWMHHVTGSEGSLSPTTQLQVVNSGDTSVTAVITSTETVGLYAIWVVNGGNQTGPIFINQAQSWGAPDLAGLSVDPGRSFRLFGHNMFLSGATPTVNFVNGSTSIPATVTTTGSDSYGLHVTAPSSLVTGTVYTITVNNGFGGNYGTTTMTNTLTAMAAGSDPFGLGVPWGSDFTAIAANVYNVKTDSRLTTHAAGDGVTDDTAAIQNAINTASSAGGGTIYFPTGTYVIQMPAVTGNHVPIDFASNVVLKGDGMTATTLKMSGFDASQYGFAFDAWECSHVGVYNMCFYNTSTGTPYSFSMTSCTKTFAIGCKFLADAGKDACWSEDEESVVRNCQIVSTNVTGTNLGEPTWFVGNADTVFTNNTVSYYLARARMMQSARTLVENNTVTRSPVDNGVSLENGGFDISDDRQLALLNNTLQKEGSGLFTDANSGETILSQGDGDAALITGTVTSTTATTLTDSTQDWTWNYGGAPQWLPQLSYYVDIVSGPGAGQIRQVLSNTANTLTVDHPWDEMPTSASGYVLHDLQNQQILVEGNSLSQQPIGIEIYGAAVLDTTIANNTLSNCGGITFIPFGYSLSSAMMETLITGNTITSSEYDYDNNEYAQIALQALYYGNAGTATLSFGTEIRNNTVTGPTPETGNEGYVARAYNGGGGYFWSNNTTVALVGTIFDNNTSNGSLSAYQLDTGDYNTTIWNPVNNQVTSMLNDVRGEAEEGPASVHASVDTTRSDLVAHWTLDESSGPTSFDSSGFDNDGTWQNSPTFSATYPSVFAPSVLNSFPDLGCLTFNGTNQYVSMGNPPNLPSGTGARTLCGWAKSSSLASGYRLIASFGTNAPGEGMYIGMYGTTLAGGGLSNTSIYSSGTFWDSNWHFVALTYDGTTAKLYGDGVLLASGAESWNLVHGSCDIGEHVASEFYWNGQIDDVRIYNRALSAAEISDLAAGNP
jgi:hypothetical protein